MAALNTLQSYTVLTRTKLRTIFLGYALNELYEQPMYDLLESCVPDLIEEVTCIHINLLHGNNWEIESCLECSRFCRNENRTTLVTTRQKWNLILRLYLVQFLFKRALYQVFKLEYPAKQSHSWSMSVAPFWVSQIRRLVLPRLTSRIY